MVLAANSRTPSERYMFHVRGVVTMEPILFHAFSSNPIIASTARGIVETSKFHQVWKGVTSVDPYAHASYGKAQKVLFMFEV